MKIKVSFILTTKSVIMLIFIRFSINQYTFIFVGISLNQYIIIGNDEYKSLPITKDLVALSYQGYSDLMDQDV